MNLLKHNCKYLQCRTKKRFSFLIIFASFLQENKARESGGSAKTTKSGLSRQGSAKSTRSAKSAKSVAWSTAGKAIDPKYYKHKT